MTNNNDIDMVLNENNNNEGTAQEDHNDRDEEEIGRRVRRRIANQLEPLDSSLARSAIVSRTNAISLENLVHESPRNISNMNRIDAQILRIVAKTSHGSNISTRTYGSTSRTRNQVATVNYSRLILVRIVTEEESNMVCYLMETSDKNKDLWMRNPTLRDDGAITIGTVIRIISPEPVTRLMAGDIPMLETRLPVIVMKRPRELFQVVIDKGISSNSSRAFVYKNCQISIRSSTVEETKCAGLFCDKQRIREVLQSKNGCGCYSMQSRRSNLVITHNLIVTNEELGFDEYFSNYSSSKFSSLYQNKPFSSSIRKSQMQMTTPYFAMMDNVDNCIQCINHNGGFTVVGWYKRGKINDQSMENDSNNQNNNRNGSNNNDEQVDNGEISYHLCVVTPSNHRFFLESSDLYNTLEANKFHVDTI
jgi:hypothetical protein